MCVQFPVAWDHPRTVPIPLLRAVGLAVHQGDVLSDEFKVLVGACIAYVCNEAPRIRQNAGGSNGRDEEILPCRKT